MQPALWFVGDRASKPAFVEEDVEVVLPEGLAVPDAKEILDFAGFAGLFAELEDPRRDLAGDLAGRRLAPSVLGFLDELRMNGQARRKNG